MEATLENLQDNKELLDYIEFFEVLQHFLLDEEKYNLKIDAITGVITFINKGTKQKKNQNFKEYFAEIDVENTKKLANILDELKVAVVNEHHESIKKIKNMLISQGMLMFNKGYLDYFSKKNKDTSVKVIPQNSEIEGTENLKKYFNWLNNDVSDLRNELLDAYQNMSLSSELVQKFVSEFKKHINGRLLLKIVRLEARQIVGIPIFLKKDGYDILPHPFLDSEWELSRPIKNSNDIGRINTGDIVAVNFKPVHSEKFLSALLFVDFYGAEIIPQTLEQALSEYVDSDYIEQAYKVFEINSGEDAAIKSFVVKKLLEISNDVENLLLSDLEQLEEIRKEVELEEEKLSKEEEKLDENRKIWHNVLKRIDKFMELEECYEIKEDTYEKIKYQPQQFILNIQSLFYHNDDHHLIYKTGVIQSFVYALQSNILTLLAGPSGTGKSSIVQAFGRAVENVEVRMVPVQSSWTDAQDLLGYFHPTDKAFVPTPFMEAMAEAALEANKSKLFLICLDEMNLAHIEYYFSEILSAREEKTPSIRLYPKRYLEIAKHTLNNDSANIEQQKNAAELIKLFPPIFKIPHNIRFIGTLNMDHTVKPISPKVIDRSFIIEMNHLNPQEKEEIKEKLQLLTGKIEMDYEKFKLTILDDSIIDDAVKRIQEISQLFEEFPNASLNSRGYKHIRHLLSFAKSEQEILEIIDYIILGKILPRIELRKTDLDMVSESVLQKLASYKLSHQRFKKMLDNKQIVRFW